MFNLTKEEIELSKNATKALLGVKVIVYRDGNWMCDAIYHNHYKLGFGDTPEAAIEDFKKANDLET